MKQACIIGASGFGGCGLIELLYSHPEIRIKQLIAKNEVNISISELFPHLKGYCDMKVESFDALDLNDTDIVFLATPDQAGMDLIQTIYDRGIPTIDYSGDFRFQSKSDYAQYALNKSMQPVHRCAQLLDKCVYGLAEKNKDQIKNARIVGNPGCFAISLILPLLPLAEANLIKGTVICDAKSGVSGAGKNPGSANFYPQRYENINTYREGSHQHLIEVEQLINRSSRFGCKVFFVPQVVPMTRGILSNIYIPSCDLKESDVHQLFSDYYKDAPFVKIVSKSPGTADVKGSNNCMIRVKKDDRTGTMLVTSVIDNLMKGQSGNAVQLANLMLGIEETAGLMRPGMFP